ncbi:AAA family ATPase [Sporofaciens musculi]|uniref:AAA family ATPase n=1 Tax=Sporofaciens musculi TaxID=2681861 RepID=UPI00258270F7|nr:AAA family ATPase [Sporofaciens musculi]
MGMFLDSIVPSERYKDIVRTRFFIDKSLMIAELISAVSIDGQKYVCITRPRRFGKSVMADMVAAFFGRTADGAPIFEGLNILSDRKEGRTDGDTSTPAQFGIDKEQVRECMNRYPVVYIDFSEIPERCSCFDEYITRILEGLKEDLSSAYPEIVSDTSKAVWDIMTEIFQKTRQRFVFVFDEWDAAFHMPFISEGDRQEFLRLLKALLKDKAYIEFAYMTGVLPIAKYSSGSEINMFKEYSMAASELYGEYFGFLEKEVDRLFEIYIQTTRIPKISRDDLRFWYDGYYTAVGERLYNPRSVVCALTDNQLKSYWTGSGPYEECYYYIKNNVKDIRDDLVLMVSGEGVKARIQEYAATAARLDTKDQIYSAMVVYGLLTYEDGSGRVFIPNKELMDRFDELLLSKESLGYVYSLARQSEKMLAATLAGDTKTMAQILEFAHDTESPILSYNHETELSALVNLVYLSARDEYRVEREDKAGKGYVDFIFYPQHRRGDALILELKVDGKPEEAIRQIRDKRYVLRFQGKLGEKPKFEGRVLAVGISYDRRTKKHSCRVEEL